MRGRVQPCCLTIAGSDSGGNAGIQADLRAFHAFGLHGCTVITALTAQNPHGVRAVHVPTPAFVAEQLDAIFEMYGVKALKTGMLATAGVIEVVATKLARKPRVKKVIDPVMVATSGAKLLADDAAAALVERLLPLATVITPNLPEAEALLGDAIETAADLRLAAKTLAKRFRCAVLIKGGHSSGGAAEDVLCDGIRFKTFSCPRIARPVSTHGTGCTMAAAITAGLACGASVSAAVEDAKIYVYEAIKLSYHIGQNCGVLGMPKKRSKKYGQGTAARHG